jgi:hypothetical protein
MFIVPRNNTIVKEHVIVLLRVYAYILGCAGPISVPLEWYLKIT